MSRTPEVNAERTECPLSRLDRCTGNVTVGDDVTDVPTEMAMAEQFDTRAQRPDRFDLHNRNVDEALARDDLCGVSDLRNGHSCHRPALHPGSCAFESTNRPPPTLQP